MGDPAKAERKMYRSAIVGDLCERFGEGAADKLIEEFGGQEFIVPRKSAGSSLEKALGQEIAAAIVEKHSGCLLAVPSSVGLLNKASRIRHTVADNPELSNNELAKKLGVTSRWVREIRRQLRGN